MSVEFTVYAGPFMRVPVSLPTELLSDLVAIVPIDDAHVALVPNVDKFDEDIGRVCRLTINAADAVTVTREQIAQDQLAFMAHLRILAGDDKQLAEFVKSWQCCVCWGVLPHWV